MPLQRAPSVASFLTSAMQTLKAGRPGDAIAPLRQAAALQPGNSTIQHDLGLACLEAGQISDAITAFQNAVAINPRYTDAYFRLGIAFEKSGAVHAAIVAYDRATELLPSLTEAWYRAGALVFTLGHREEAIGCFRRASATGGSTSFGRLGKARALLAEARDADAERVLRQLLARDPSNAMAHDLLGNILADAGRFDDARACFERAINTAPLMAGSYYDLVRCRRLSEADADLVPAMHEALATPGLQAEQRIRVHLALGKARDDLGDPEAAMEQFDAADAIRRQLVSFDAVEFGRQVDTLIARFPRERFAQADVSEGGAAGETEIAPVLIVGMPRSGTTLTEQIISNHPSVRAAGELNYWNEHGAAWLKADPLRADTVLDEAAHGYLRLLRTIGPAAARVTDKMPFNFLWAGLIHLACPRATIIHCRRSAIDTALSIHQTLFNPQLALPTGGAELVDYVRSYQRLMAHWRNVLPADCFIESDYEDLTVAPEPVIRRIIAACGLEWDETCLRPELNARAVKTPSRWQARQPIYRHAVERWRRYEPWLGALTPLLSGA